MQKTGILLDVTGTVVDITDHFINTYKEARQNYKLTPLSEDELFTKAASDYMRVVHNLGLGTPERLEYVKCLWNKNLDEKKYKIELYPGARMFMNEIEHEENIDFVLTTGDHRDLINIYKKILKINQSYRAVTRDDVKRPKPDSNHLETARKMIGTKRGNTVVIDDMPDTLRTAKNLGMHTIAASWGFCKYEPWKLEKTGAFVASNFEDVLAEVRRIQEGI